MGCDTARSYKVRLIRKGSDYTLIDWTYEPTIRSNGPNRLGVSARGPALYFFINDELVNTVVDAGIASGHIGVVAESYGKGEISIAYDNLSLQGIR